MPEPPLIGRSASKSREPSKLAVSTCFVTYLIVSDPGCSSNLNFFVIVKAVDKRKRSDSKTGFTQSSNMSDQASTITSTMEILHSDGDVILVVGSDKQKYRDSTPRGSPESIGIICKVMHLKQSDLPESLPLVDFLEFARIADKYECAEALRYIALAWFQEVEQHQVGGTWLVSALIDAAYLLKLRKKFRQWTGFFAYERHESYAGIGITALPARAYRKLTRHLPASHLSANRRTICLERQRKEARDHLSSLLAKSPTCTRCAQFAYLVGMNNTNVVPRHNLYKLLNSTPISIRDASDSIMKAFGVAYDEDALCYSFNNKTSYSQHLWFSSLPLKAVEEHIKGVKGKCRGLCLTCVLEGNDDPDNCEEDH
ncbi:hypothetical protein H2203_009190 [Taxawa tesnikishii (nom. ined.)]|nr:hypothetical protein H2203_009190 [Dothideales sp. JES 119]